MPLFAPCLCPSYLVLLVAPVPMLQLLVVLLMLLLKLMLWVPLLALMPEFVLFGTSVGAWA